MEPAPTILVVDDVPLFRELGSLFLSRYGHVHTAASGEEALEQARRHWPAVIVLDFQLPDLPGEQVLRALAKAADGRKPPAVVALAGGAPEEHARAIRAGASDVLAKPLSRVSLVEAVTRFLRFPEVRGLPRVELASPARLRAGACEGHGVLRNVSRGGLFVETEWSAPPGSELRVEFRLPEERAELAPTARVVWRRPSWRSARGGLGMRFLELDAESARRIDTFVHERFVPPSVALSELRAAGLPRRAS